MLWGMVFMALTNLCQFVIPWFWGEATTHVEAVLKNEAEGGLPWKLVIGVAVFAVGLLGARFGWRWFLIGSARRIAAELRADYAAHVQSLTLPEYAQLQTGDLMSRATSDITAIQRMVAFGFGVGLDILLHGVVLVSLLAWIDFELMLWCLPPIALTPLIYLLVNPRLRLASTRLQEASATLAALAQETFAGIHVVKSFANEDVRDDRFLEASGSYAERGVAVSRLNASLGPVIRLLMGVSLFVTLYVGGPRLVAGTIESGDLFKFFSYLTLLSWAFYASAIVAAIFQQGLSALTRLREIFALPIEPDGEDVTISKGLEVRALDFAYSGSDPVLHDVSFTVQSGEVVGLIGPVGAGKSTLLSLLVRLEEPPVGTMFFDGVDLATLDPRALRRRIAFIPQESFLFSDTVTANVSLPVLSADEKVVLDRLRLSRIADEVDSLPLGLNTILGERGTSLSGGQKQRLTVARALMPQSDWLIVDDALSALDATTASALVDNLFDHAAGRTVMIASHRLSLMRRCDRVLVFDEGRLVQMGTPAELARDSEGLYARLARLQSLELDS